MKLFIHLSCSFIIGASLSAGGIYYNSLPFWSVLLGAFGMYLNGLGTKIN